MKKKLMQQQESRIANFLKKEVQQETIERAQKYVIDSVYENRVRLVTSTAKESIPKKIMSKELAKFNLWKAEDIQIMETEEASRMLGVRRNQIKEGNVFVRLEDRTFEITEFVRQEVKDHYKQLLKREFASPEKKERCSV
jgi:hypothetical protein